MLSLPKGPKTAEKCLSLCKCCSNSKSNCSVLKPNVKCLTSFSNLSKKIKESSFCSELINKIFTHYKDLVKRILNIVCFMFQKIKVRRNSLILPEMIFLGYYKRHYFISKSTIKEISHVSDESELNLKLLVLQQKIK